MALSLGYAELKNARCRGFRNRRRWNSLDDCERGLLNSAIEFTKRGYRITNAKVIAGLRAVFGKLGIVSRTRVLLEGMVKAVQIRSKVREKNTLRWIPRIRTWLKENAYIFWLGTLQITLEGFYPDPFKH